MNKIYKKGNHHSQKHQLHIEGKILHSLSRKSKRALFMALKKLIAKRTHR